MRASTTRSGHGARRLCQVVVEKATQERGRGPWRRSRTTGPSRTPPPSTSDEHGARPQNIEGRLLEASGAFSFDIKRGHEEAKHDVVRVARCSNASLVHHYHNATARTYLRYMFEQGSPSSLLGVVEVQMFFR